MVECLGILELGGKMREDDSNALFKSKTVINRVSNDCRFLKFNFL
jgi:hypothetical protein